jgi:hypothetical protein
VSRKTTSINGAARFAKPMWFVSVLSFATSIFIYLQIRTVTDFFSTQVVNEYLYIRRWTAIVDAFVLLGSFNIVVEKLNFEVKNSEFTSFCAAVFVAACVILLITISATVLSSNSDALIIFVDNIWILTFIIFGYCFYIVNYTLLKAIGKITTPDVLQCLALGLVPTALIWGGRYYNPSGGQLALVSYIPLTLVGLWLMSKNIRYFWVLPKLSESISYLTRGIPRTLHFNFSNFIFFIVITYIISNESAETSVFYGVFFVFLRLTETFFEGYSRSIASVARINNIRLQDMLRLSKYPALVSAFLCGVLFISIPELFSYFLTLLFPVAKNYPNADYSTKLLFAIIPFYIYIIISRPAFDPMTAYKRFLLSVSVIFAIDFLFLLPYLQVKGEANYGICVLFSFACYSILLSLYRKK